MKRVIQSTAAVLLLLVVGSCNDINKQSSPVALVVTNSQVLTRIDLATDAPNCNKSAGTIQLRAVQLQPPTTITSVTGANLNQIRTSQYQVSYVRTDGGHLVPAPFSRSISVLVSPGQTQDVSTFLILQSSALFEAPFAALQPANGGRDPETGKPSISMDIIVQVWGETLAGERVTGSTRMTFTFCIACGGCS
jgi:hypothetical protein